MVKISFEAPGETSFKVLCLGAHSDDIEIGCGGMVLKLQEDYPDLEVCWVVFSSDKVRSEEAKESAKAFLQGAKASRIEVLNFQDSFFPYTGKEIKEYFIQLKREFSPDLIFTHYRNDLHQDHRLISELTWNSFRDHLIFEYEIPKYDGDFGTPNFFVPLREELCRKKIQNILDNFSSQAEKQWFSEETFRAILRLRGIEINSPSLYAEAFYCKKLVY
jgi:LmbE family N-acetylglucosaminyl deacetylase